MVESEKLQLLEKRINTNYDVDDQDYIKNNVIPFIQTDVLIEEVANLKLEKLPSGKLTVKQQTKRIDKDKFSSLAYGLYYIKTFEDNIYREEEEDMMFFMD
jgi:ribonucleoside-diphosphate reductase alpha chain